MKLPKKNHILYQSLWVEQFWMILWVIDLVIQLGSESIQKSVSAACSATP